MPAAEQTATDTTAREARDKIAAARVWLMKYKPFFGVLARALRVQVTERSPGFRLYADDRLLVHPLAVQQKRFAGVCARLAHLSMHAALDAFGRRKERDQRRWNLAHDLAIAPLMQAAELSEASTLDPFVELPEGSSAEAYFEALPSGSAPEPALCDLCDPDPNPTAPEEEPRENQNEPQSDPESESTNIDERAQALQWKMRLAAAYEEEVRSGHKTFGDMPGWIDDWVRATIEPPADWTLVLQRAVSALTRTGRSYLRPSRRMAALAFDQPDGSWPSVVSMPGRRVEQGGQLVAVVDTSASIDNKTLSRFMGAVVSVASAEGIDEVRLLQSDVVVLSDEVVFAAELLFREVAIHGRGGTRFDSALRRLNRDAKRACHRFTVVYLTDLEGPEPDAALSTHLDLLWVVPDKPARTPSCGRVLRMYQR